MLEDGCQEAEIFTLHKMRHQSMVGFAVGFFSPFSFAQLYIKAVLKLKSINVSQCILKRSL